MFHGSELVSTFLSEPTCVVVSADGELMVVGTAQGTLHLISTRGGQVGVVFLTFKQIEDYFLVSYYDSVFDIIFLTGSEVADQQL